MDTAQTIHDTMKAACEPALIASRLGCIMSDLKTHRRVQRAFPDDRELETVLLELNMPLIYYMAEEVVDEDRLFQIAGEYGDKEAFGELTLEALRMGQFSPECTSPYWRGAAVLLHGCNSWSTLFGGAKVEHYRRLTSTAGWKELGGLLSDTWPTVLALLPTVPTTKNPTGKRKLYGLTTRAWMTLRNMAARAETLSEAPSADLENSPSVLNAFGTVCMPAHPFYGIRSDEDVRRQLVLWKHEPAKVMMHAHIELMPSDLLK